MSKSRTPSITPWLFLAPFLVTFAVFTIYPLSQSFVLSFQQTFGPRSTVPVGFENFRYLSTDPLFWIALKNTVIFTLGSLCVQLPLSLGLALLLNRPELKGRSLFRLIFFAPSLVGLVFVGMIFSLIFEKRTGLLNVALHSVIPQFPLEFPWLQNYVMPALIIAALWLYVGFNMVYFLAALQNVPGELMESAGIDGAGPWDRFIHVTLPHITPVAGFVVLLSILGSFQLFELPFVLLGGSGPENRGLTLVMYLYNTGFVTGDLGYASAIGWVLALILASVTIVQRTISRKGEE